MQDTGTNPVKIWVLTYFDIGAGLFTKGMWCGCPSVRQIQRATDLPPSEAAMILDGATGGPGLEAYDLCEEPLPKGEL